MPARPAKRPASPAALRRRLAARRAAAALRRADQAIAEVIRRVGVHHPVITPDPFRTLVSSIIQQQVSMAAAAGMQRKLRALCPGGRITPPALLDLTPARLRQAGLSWQKAGYVRGVADAFATRRITGRKLRRLDDEDVIACVTELKGIGRWTAEMLLIFCLERADVWPIDDLGLRKAVRSQLSLADLPPAGVMLAYGETFRPYRSYASWYLWRSLEGPFMPGIDAGPTR